MIKFLFCLWCLIAFAGFAISSYDKTHPTEAEFVAQKMLEYDMSLPYNQQEPTTPIIRFKK